MNDLNAKPSLNVDVAIIGGGPAGLMAAEVLSRAGLAVHLFDAMPSVGRKFLLAGKGGLNLTHSEAADRFAERYGERRHQIDSLLRAWTAHGASRDQAVERLDEMLRGTAVWQVIAQSLRSIGRLVVGDAQHVEVLRALRHHLLLLDGLLDARQPVPEPGRLLDDPPGLLLRLMLGSLWQDQGSEPPR